jgi:signal transduction histidine kinase/ActR/RegA family two-component response regulator
LSHSQGSLFNPEAWSAALEKYGAATQFTVNLYDDEQRIVCGSAPSSPIFAVFEKYGYDPGIFLACARECVAQTVERPAVMVAPAYGLAVVGTSLLLEGSIVGAAVAGYALIGFSPSSAIEQLAHEAHIPFHELWNVVRKLQPVPRRRLSVLGELLQVLGDAILRENYRMRQYEQAALKAEAADRAKDQFLAMVSHELRTPLTAILGWSYVLSHPKSSAEMTSQASKIIERNAAIQKQLVDDLLDMSRITSGKLQLNVEPVELTSVVKDALDVVRLAASAKRIELRLRLDPDETEITGDRSRLQQVVWNLLSNAIKFTPAGGWVEVQVERSDPYVYITVADNGKGIKQEFFPHLFVPFSQDDLSSTRRYSGLGLGLTIVRHVIELHGGTITVNSGGEGQGATFRVGLPIRAVRTKPVEAGTTGARPIVTASVPARLEGLRALVVDDQADARDLLTAVLTQFGVQVMNASSCAEALASLLENDKRQNRPDVLISDIGMPDEDGYALIRKVRNLEPDQGGLVPAIALTAYARTEDRARALAAGFQAHLGKPIDPEELKMVIAGLTGRLAA